MLPKQRLHLSDSRMHELVQGCYKQSFADTLWALDIAVVHTAIAIVCVLIIVTRTSDNNTSWRIPKSVAEQLKLT